MDDADHGNDPTNVLRLRRLDSGLPLPVRAHPTDAGIDLLSAADVELRPGHRALVGTGVAVAVPGGSGGLAHRRSGLAPRAGLPLGNAPGTGAAGYRGEGKGSL